MGLLGHLHRAVESPAREHLRSYNGFGDGELDLNKKIGLPIKGGRFN